MPADEGYQRDVEVLKLIRGHLGDKIELGVDANDGYDLPRTKRLLSDLPDFDFAFIEEMFPEDIEKYLELKTFIKDRGWRTLIADGENTRRPEQMQPWVDARAVDILQGDMNLYGFEDILREAAMGRPQGIRIAPHNWGSLVGYYLQLQVGRAITNFYRAEQDPISAPALVAEGYTIKEGTSSIPEAPGLGLSINEKAFADGAKVVFDIKA
jgi:L-alanine-DL-glutamate epimerase-like enolase superfamily enzyme